MIRSTVRGVACASALSCALGLIVGERRAFAHAQGTVFSSPVDGDGAALFWNPAAMAASTTSRVDLVGNLSIPQSSYQRTGIDGAQGGRPFPKVSLVGIRPEPTLGLIVDKLWHQRLRIGVTVTVPTAAGAAWPASVVDTNGQTVLGPTRYHVTEAQIFHAYTMLGASIALHRTFSIGASVNIVLSRLDVMKDVDLANQAPIRDALPCAKNPLGCENPALSAPLHLAGTGISVGGSVGALWQPIKQLRIGAGYVSQVKVNVGLTLSIDAQKLSDFARQFLPQFQTLAVNGTGTAQVTVPQRFHFAIAGDVHPRIELMAMVRWVNYSATEIISGGIRQKSSTLVPDSLDIPSVKNDEWMVTARIVGRVRDRWKLGFSIEYVTKTVPDAYMTPSNLDFDVVSLNCGANVRVWKKLYLGASLSQSLIVPRTITKSVFSNESPEPYGLPNPAGSYTANSEKIGIDVSAMF